MCDPDYSLFVDDISIVSVVEEFAWKIQGQAKPYTAQSITLEDPTFNIDTTRSYYALYCFHQEGDSIGIHEKPD